MLIKISLPAGIDLSAPTLAVGADMRDGELNPFAPTGNLLQVREEFRSVVIGAFGEVYAFSQLAIRACDDGIKKYAPVASIPGNVLVFTWPAAALNDAWVEPVQN